MLADICTGLISVFTLPSIGAIALGILTGLIFGAIPGISGIMAISILLPMTFYVSPLVGIPMLLGIYKASMFGGSITAVLLNTPGAPPAVCTAMDGFPLTRQGKAGKALNAALTGSVFGDTFSNILLICVAAPLAYLTLKIGPVEQCCLILLALTVVGSISGPSLTKGIICAGVGILLATVGASGATGAIRFTFDNENLMGGIALIPMVIGLLCLPEVIHQASSRISSVIQQKLNLKDENGRCAGAVLQNMETKELLVAKAKTVILATGGAGRLHYQGFPTSNHYGATADGLVLGYRAGAKLLYPDTLQYHPTGAAYPAQIYGALVTEKVRSVGAMLVNADGEVFMNPLETRDVAAASIIRECTERGKGVRTPAGQAVWLDTPMIELKNGKGTIEKRIPAMMRMFAKHGIDIRTEPILVYPTLHYQNGGLHITPDGQTDVENLFAAGEVVGGIHGRNRLMGNSLLDVIVFGRNAGQHAAEKAKSVTVGALTLSHVAAFEAEKRQAGVSDHRPSPQLLPDYARKIHPVK